jgi:hypothetical protein
MGGITKAGRHDRLGSKCDCGCLRRHSIGPKPDLLIFVAKVCYRHGTTGLRENPHDALIILRSWCPRVSNSSGGLSQSSEITITKPSAKFGSQRSQRLCARAVSDQQNWGNCELYSSFYTPEQSEMGQLNEHVVEYAGLNFV